MNAHIRTACKQYVTQKMNPEYAIMINGKWGSGKTYFVSSLQNEPWLMNSKENKDEQIVKISLYGIKTKEDIETQMFFSVNSVLSAKKFRKVGGFLNDYIGNKFNIDGKTAISLLLKEWSSKVKVIIVDDLERSSMAIHEVLGYFYNYIVEYNIRVILIGNEDEIKDRDGEVDTHYKRTKEKVIGEIYTIQPQIKEAIEIFLSPDSLLDIPLSTEKAVKICLEVTNNLQIHNLRTIRQGLVKVQRLLNRVIETDSYNIVDYDDNDYLESDRTKDDYLAEIFEVFLVVYLQFTIGDFSKTDQSILWDSTSDDKSRKNNGIISDVIGVYKNSKCSLKSIKEIEEKDDKHVRNRNSFQISTSKLFQRMARGFVPLQSSNGAGDKVWSDYIFDSKLDNGLLENVVKEDRQWFIPSSDVTSSLYKLVSRSLHMEQKEFEECYNLTMKKFKHGKYNDVGELMQGYSLCLNYKKYDVRKYEKGEIKKLFDEILQNTVIDIDVDVDYEHTLTRGSLGYQYTSDMTDGEGKEFSDKLRVIINEKKLEKSRTEFIEEFERVDDVCSMGEWLKLLRVNDCGRDYNRYYKKPVLSWITAEQIFSKLIKLPFDSQVDFVDVLDERYELRYANGEFKDIHFPDYKELIELDMLYMKYIEKIGSGNIMNYSLKVIKERYERLIEYCKPYIEVHE